jgi:hypothetical protein
MGKNLCDQGTGTNFFKSVAVQGANMVGAGSTLSASGLDTQSELLDEIKTLQDKLKAVEWQATIRLFREQDVVNSKVAPILQKLREYINENANYVDTKYIFADESLTIVDNMFSILTTVLVFVILYFLKFN